MVIAARFLPGNRAVASTITMAESKLAGLAARTSRSEPRDQNNALDRARRARPTRSSSGGSTLNSPSK
jgi:hypothetical protein